MNFIEELFGWAPDGGTGSLEWMILLIPLAVALLVARKRRWHRRG